MRRVICGLLLFLALTAHSVQAERPNIVFLLADDQSTWSMGCYDTPGARTPQLDQLARDGMVFDRHYDTTAICMASRATIMTGLFEYRTGCNFDHGALLEEHWQASYPLVLREAGYQTAFAGKFGFVVSPTPGNKGRLPERDFDRWGGGPGQTSYATKKNKSMAEYADEYPHSTRSYGAFGRDFIKDAAAKESPFCLSISFKAPHHPVDPDPMFDDVFRDMTFSRPGNYGRPSGEHLSRQSRLGRQYERFHSWHYSDRYDETMALYFQQIHAIDYAVGMIRKAIEQAGVADNTVIIYTSDNGFMNGSHGYGSKVIPYEESTRVPLILFDPRHSHSGRQLRCQTLTGNVDIAPTILDLAGLAVPSGIDGRSLLPLYDDPTVSIHETLPLINVWGPAPVHSLAVVSTDWKFVYWPWAEDDFEATEELFHLDSDRLELINVRNDPAQAAAVKLMQQHYDRAVAHWNEHAVPYHNYQPFGTLFDRGKTWETKRQAMPKRGRKRTDP